MSLVPLVITCGRLLRKILNNIHVARALGQMMSDDSSRCFIYLRFSSNPWFPLPFLDVSRICRCKMVHAAFGPCLFSWNFLRVVKAQGIHCSERPARASSHGTKSWSVSSVLRVMWMAALPQSLVQLPFQWWKAWRRRSQHLQVGLIQCGFMWKRWDPWCPNESCQVNFFKRWFYIEESYPHASVVKHQTCNMEVHLFFRWEDCFCGQGFGFTIAILAVSMAQKLGLQSPPRCKSCTAPKLNLYRFGSLPTRGGQGFHVQRWSGEKTAFKNFLLKYHGDTWHVSELPIVGPMTSP